MHNILKNILLATFLCSAQITFGMECGRINPDAALLQKLIQFHESTSSSGYSPKPDMEKFQKPGRHFVAKMNSFGLDRYFTFSTNEGVKSLVKTVQQGGGKNVAWFYYDQEKKDDDFTDSVERFTQTAGFAGHVQQFTQNVVVISDPKDADKQP